tara:strand:+ start:21005 stop:22606 length:1602 start_codon:yes stop_codon:yes gene_type:complete
MGRVLTNNTSLAYAIETSLGVLPASPTWFLTEPNTIGAFGANPTKVSRSPISKLRQRRKGTIVDQEAPTEYEEDLTMTSIGHFVEGFLYATATNSDMLFRGADVLATGFTVPALTAAQAAKLVYDAASGPTSLVYAFGYANTINNGMHEIDVDPVTTDLLIPTLTVTTVETAPTNAEVHLAGVRPELGDLALSIVSTIGTLTSGNGAAVNAVDFTVLGLTVGQRIHIGGDVDANRFGSTAAADGTRSYGGARIRAIAAGSLTLDKLDATLVASDGTDDGNAGTEIRTDLLFGRFVRNVSVDDAAYLERSIQFEAELPNLYETTPPTPVGNPDGYWYNIGQRANQMQLNNPLTDKATINFGFVGTTSDAIVDNSGRKTNAITPIEPVRTAAFNTAADFFRLGILDVDETGLTSDFKDMTATINNNAGGEKVLGFLGNKFINNGNFEVDIETTVLFTSPTVIARVLAGTTVTAGWVQRNGDGAVSVDIPSGELAYDGIELPVNESVRIPLTLSAFVDDFFQTSMGVSLFPFYPAA